jgi:hypothetical protein
VPARLSSDTWHGQPPQKPLHFLLFRSFCRTYAPVHKNIAKKLENPENQQVESSVPRNVDSDVLLESRPPRTQRGTSWMLPRLARVYCSEGRGGRARRVLISSDFALLM